MGQCAPQHLRHCSSKGSPAKDTRSFDTRVIFFCHDCLYVLGQKNARQRDGKGRGLVGEGGVVEGGRAVPNQGA
jgi:hypothetical protein